MSNFEVRLSLLSSCKSPKGVTKGAGDEARGGVVDVSRGVAVLIDLLHFVASAGPPILLLALSTAQMLPACPSECNSP